jgi:hypothetical protein
MVEAKTGRSKIGISIIPETAIRGGLVKGMAVTSGRVRVQAALT